MHVHFIGIGGIGVSALARFYLAHGASISGSDLFSSEITKELEQEGVFVSYGPQQKSNIPRETKLVVYTSAIPASNPELREAKNRRIKIRSYAEVLGELTKKYHTITISGSHGKSTTTALSALVLQEGYFDPTVIVGTKLKEFGGGNFRVGWGRHLVLEADEWNKSFLNYSPQIAIITNIDAEHLDTYRTAENVEKTFEQYLKRVPGSGVIIANRDDPRLYGIAKKFEKKVVWYSRQSREASHIRKILKVPGEHNVSNALAALTLGRVLGIHEPVILKAISSFHGTWRRFEFKGVVRGAHIFDDYGHHPREITATIAAARARFPFRRVWCIYQPHQYRRLSLLWNDFIPAFDLADNIRLLPVYDVAGRETKSAKNLVNSAKLARELSRRGKNALHLKTFADAVEHMHANLKTGDVVLMMGAGDIYKLTESLSSYHAPEKLS